MQRRLAPYLGFAAALLAVSAPTASGQLTRPGAPASFGTDLPGDASELPVRFVPAPDVEALLAEDALRDPFPLRYGAVLPVELDLARHGRWDETEGTLVWRMEIAAPGALSLGLQFGVFDLPAGGELFVYTPDRVTVLGAFTREVRLGDGSLPIQPVPGDRLVLEYVHPAEARGEPELVLESVVYDYRGVFGSVPTPGVAALSASCLVDVNCPEGDDYQVIKNAVVGLYRGGFACSGSLLNNTARDGTPYMLTAEHCGSMTNAVVVFGYERTGCNSGPSSNSQSVAGATLLATDDLVDSQLYLLDQAPPKSYEPYYAGWDRRGDDVPGPAISISHPAGLPKKIAADAAGPLDWGTSQWAADWDYGTILGGSSGSPLFSGEGLVLGPCCCVTQFSCGVQTTFYGRFGRFWNRGSLAQWLDPVGDGRPRLLGFDPCTPPSAEVVNGSGVNPVVYASSPPTLGQTWTGTVDASAFPQATSTVLVGTTAGSSGTVLPFGELLVDFGSTLLFRSTQPVAGTVSTHGGQIPNDGALAGSVLHTQAVLVGGGVQATNGIVLTLN